MKEIYAGDPKASVRSAAKAAKVGRGTTHRILRHDLQEKCFKTVKAQCLGERQVAKRLRICKQLKQMISCGELDVNKIFFAGEKLFCVGQVGKKSPRNNRLRQDEGTKKKDIDPKLLIRGKKQGGVGVMASLGMRANGVGTLRFAERGVKINQAAYLDLVKSVYRPEVEMLIGGGYTFQQDGATSHTAKSVTKWIKDEGKFPILPWCPNSPDLNPLDYAAWGILEPRVFDANPKTEVELRRAIRKAVAALNPEEIKKSALQFERRLDMCIANNGRHFEYQM